MTGKPDEQIAGATGGEGQERPDGNILRLVPCPERNAKSAQGAAGLEPNASEAGIDRQGDDDDPGPAAA